MSNNLPMQSITPNPNPMISAKWFSIFRKQLHIFLWG